MKPTPCVCKREDCKVALGFDSGSDALLMTTKEGGEQLMYIDANTVVALIGNLREMLVAMAAR